jgi:hypothetical protein
MPSFGILVISTLTTDTQTHTPLFFSLSGLTHHTNILDGNTHSALWKDRQPQERHGRRDIVIARKCRRNYQATGLSLKMTDGAIAAVYIGTTAAARETRSARFAAKLTVDAANSSLSRASKAGAIVQATAIDATQSKAQDYLVFIDSIIATAHDSETAWEV